MPDCRISSLSSVEIEFSTKWISELNTPSLKACCSPAFKSPIPAKARCNHPDALRARFRRARRGHSDLSLGPVGTRFACAATSLVAEHVSRQAGFLGSSPGLIELDSVFVDPTGKVNRMARLFLPKHLTELILFRIGKIKANAAGR